MADNVTSCRTFAFLQLFFVLSTFSLNWTSGDQHDSSYSHSFDFQTTRSHSMLNSKRSWRLSGLFLNEQQLQRLRKRRVLNDVFSVESSTASFPLNGTCAAPAGVDTVQEMPKCNEYPSAAASLIGENWEGTLQGCCNTIMSVESPQTVTSEITGLRHQVLQFAFSSQLVHVGRCQNEGGMCVLGGRCTTVHRIQWLLVQASSLTSPGFDDDDDDEIDDDTEESSFRSSFVPTKVANHCQCVFS